MVNKSGNIGTEFETACRKAIGEYFPEADRKRTRGSKDVGDIGNAGIFVFEMKAGRQTSSVTDLKLAQWMGEADVEAENARLAFDPTAEKYFGILVTKRHNINHRTEPRRQWAWLHSADLAELMGGFWRPGRFSVVRMELGDLLDLLADQGYVPNSAPPVTTAEIAIITADAALSVDLEEFDAAAEG